MRDPGLRSQYRTELQVGLLLIAGLIALVLGVVWISGAQPGGGKLEFFAVAPEAAAVTEGTRVTLLGVDIGAVERVELRPRDVVLRLRVSYEGALPRDTRGEIRASGFLGSMEVALLPGSEAASLVAGDTIAALPTSGLQSLASQLGDRASEILARTERLLSDTLIVDVHSTTGSLSGAMREVQGLLEDEAAALETLIEGLSSTSARLAEATRGSELERTIASVDSLTSRLAAASSDLESGGRSLASILDKIDRGEGTLGRLLNEPELYDRLAATTENIQTATEEIALLTRDLRERPERYLRGAKFSVF